MSLPDYYRLLGIGPEHEPDELKEAFLARWKEAEGTLRGERVFLRHLGASPRRRDLLREAYTVLSEPALRTVYHHRAGIAPVVAPRRVDRRGGAAAFREGCRRLVHREYEEAYRLFRRAIDRSPGVANFLNYAAFALMVPDLRRDVARMHLAESLALDAGRAETLLLSSWMQHRGGAHRLAEQTLRRAATGHVIDVPLFLRLRQVAEIAPVCGGSVVRRVLDEARSVFGIPIRISVR